MRSAQTRQRRCPRCERQTAADGCCGIDLTVRRSAWHMTPENIRLVHVLKARKGLDDDTYRLRLSAVGVGSSTQLSRDGFRTFLAGMAALPDSPAWVVRSSTTRSARG